MKDSLKLVLSCYACAPNRGSEPGVGWAWALGMAKRHNVLVLTRAKNKKKIEDEIDRLNIPQEERPQFAFIDLAPFWSKLKSKKILPTPIYYYFWQRKARKTLDALNFNADIIHHVTWCSYVMPGLWYNRKEKVVLGPMGGFAIVPTPFLRIFGKKRIIEYLRGISRKTTVLSFFFQKSIKHTNAVVFTEKKHAKKYHGFSQLDVAISDNFQEGSLTNNERKHQFLWAGNSEPRKALEIACIAFAKACRNGLPEDYTLKICGISNKEVKFQRLISSLDMQNRIFLEGRLSQEALWEEMGASKALVFTSVRDTCGCVNVEAMAHACPVICFNHQGVGEITDDSCAIRIEPTGWNEAIDGFADAMVKIATDDKLQKQLGENAKKRAFENYTWEKKFDFFDKIYEKTLNP